MNWQKITLAFIAVLLLTTQNLAAALIDESLWEGRTLAELDGATADYMEVVNNTIAVIKGNVKIPMKDSGGLRRFCRG